MAKATKNAAKTSKATSEPKAVKAPKAVAKAKTPQVAAEKAPKASGEFGYREGGNYHFCCLALKSLGLGKKHTLEDVVKAVRSAMGPAAWKAFAGKEARNEETGKEAADRVLQNCAVLSRKKSESADYAAPLRERGLRVEFSKREGYVGMFKIGK